MKTTETTPKQTVMEKLMKPLPELTAQSTYTRKCSSLSDEEWLRIGILRSLSAVPSGRAFLQELTDHEEYSLKRSHYFETLKSERRLKFCHEIDELLFDQLKSDFNRMDPFKNFSCLDNFDIYAGDGHYHASATHDPRKEGKQYAVQHFYSLNLRNHALKHLVGADVSGTRKKEHDMRALKSLNTSELRQNAPKGRQVIYTWDKAGIDFRQWYNWKHSGGIYFISREKENMKLDTLGVLDFDRTDDLNTGVLSYELCGTSCGVSVHRVKYKDPVTKTIYSFITSLSQLPPGLIAYIYKLRWDIEKVFDQVKNKMEEKKAWATSVTAKTMQAVFICLAHNLMLIMEDELENEQGIVNEIESRRKKKRLDKEIVLAKQNGVELPKHLRFIKRFTQRSVKFVRWLRNNIFRRTSWQDALGSLRLSYADF